MAEITIYQDQDPLGKGSWYGYASKNGHIFANFGGFATELEAIQEGEKYK